jgi:DNA-directed RNA polymerase I, II, and III subunit RPABC2
VSVHCFSATRSTNFCSEEPLLDEDDLEIEEPENYDEPADGAEDVGGGDDPAAKDDNIIHSGDTSQQKKIKNTVAELKKKKIPKEKRSTTPYMTKYERARVLGTRALQIR